MEHFPTFVHEHLSYGHALPALIVGIAWPWRRRARKETADVAVSLADSGLGYAMLGRFKEAVEHFEKAEAAGLRDAILYCNWGQALSHLGEHAPACEMYLLATELDPTLADALVNWGVSLAALGRHEEACERYERAISLDSANAVTYFNWAGSLAHLGRLADACEMYERAAKLDSRDAQIHYNWAICLRRTGRMEEADEHLRSFLELAKGRFSEQAKRARELLGNTDGGSEQAATPEHPETVERRGKT